MLDLVARGACGAPGFIGHLHPRASPHRVHIDLSRMSFCEPIGLVGIAAFAERALREDERVVVTIPEDSNVANYLSRMRLGGVLAALGAEHELPVVREHDVGPALFELSAFDGARGAGALAALVHQAVEPYDEVAAHTLYDALCEVGQNVAHHSGQKRRFLAAQRTHQGKRLCFAVGDSGKGMLATLRARGARDDADALKLALRPGVTETADRSRGVGLPDVVREVSALRGSLHVVSGAASVTARGSSRWYGSGEGSFQGTLVQGEVFPAHAIA